jgi:phytoene dehydrogenase-like protein
MADIIVIGGGHNGLVAAATLGKAGKRVVLLEQRDQVGGVCDLLFDGTTVSADVAKTLGLKADASAVPVALSSDGRTLDLGASIEDPGYAGWRAWVDKVAPVLGSQLSAPAPDIRAAAPLWPLAKAGMSVRKLGKKDMMELLRSAPSCVDDWLTEHMSDGLLKAALMAPALQGTWMGPRSPTSAASLLLMEATREVDVVPAALATQLRAACEAAGVEIQTGAKVARIRVEDGLVVGVELANGAAIDAPVVLSAVGPKTTLLDLLDPRVVSGKTAHQADVIRVRGTLAQLRLEVSGIDWPGTRLRIVDDPLHLERAFDDVKFRRLPTVPPPLEVSIEGSAVRINCWSAPYELDGGWTDEARRLLTDAIFDSLERVVPGVRDAATVTELLTPADIEEQYGLAGGHLNHGELALDQLGPMRPSMQLSGYRTPISGLWLGCSGVHPGGGISGRPGLLAARAILGQ